MITFYKKYYRTAFDILLMIVTIYLFMLAFSYLYRIAAPIFLALIIYAIIEPTAKFLHRRGIKKSIAAAMATLLFLLIISGLFIGLGAILAAQIHQLSVKIPEYLQILQQQILSYNGLLQDKMVTLDPAVIDKAQEYAALITTKASQIAAGLLGSFIAALTSFSTFLVNFVAGIILAYFLSIESEDWKKIAINRTPKTFKTAFYFLKDNVLLGIISYVKAQLKLISITFVLIFVSLLLLNVNNSLTIALLAALFDVLPLLGVATLFIPWIVYLFITGSTTLAIWLSVLLGVVVLIRQILEPKITGDSLGVSAFTMLSFMIISLSLFGVAGLILSPILIILIKALYEQGYLKKWIRTPQGEYEDTITTDTVS